LQNFPFSVSFHAMNDATTSPLLQNMRWMREHALGQIDGGGPNYTIDEIEEGDCGAGDAIGRTLEGTMQAPLYLTSWDPGSLLTRVTLPDGRVLANGGGPTGSGTVSQPAAPPATAPAAPGAR
jgi:hypothetical protein